MKTDLKIKSLLLGATFLTVGYVSAQTEQNTTATQQVQTAQSSSP